MRFWMVFALACLTPLSAAAVGQDEASLQAGAGLAVAMQGGSHSGVEAELRLVRGITDAWSVRLGLQGAILPATDGNKTGTLISQAAGVTWAFDVVNWVPFIDLGVVVADVRGAGHGGSQRFGGQAGVGFDYLLSRHTFVSCLGRVDYFPLRLAGADVPRPTLLSFVLHLGRTF
jgi:hypothetical protein